MSSGRAVEALVAVNKGTTWGTPTAVGASDGLWVLEVPVARVNRAFIEDDSKTGTPWGNKGDAGAKLTELTLRVRGRYEHNFPKLLAYAFGTSGSPSGPTDGVYTHALTLADSLTVFQTVAVKKPMASATKYDEYASMMIEEARVTWRQGEPLTADFRMVGADLDRSSAVNGSTQFGNVTMPGGRTPILGSNGRFRINAASGSTLGSSDALKPVAGEIVIRRPLSRDFLMDSSLPDHLSQPVEEGPCEVFLTVEFAGLGGSGTMISSDEDWAMDAFEAGTEYKADVLFTGPVVGGGSTTATILFQFPRLQVVEMPTTEIPAAGRLSHRVTFRGLVAAAAPTGMSGVTQPIKGVIVDSISADYLA